jgi:hypothetical protein
VIYKIASLDIGAVPQDWRDAWVVPIFKKGERHIAANYRLVSLTSIVCEAGSWYE